MKSDLGGVPRRAFGRHSTEMVSALGLGGYHIGKIDSDREAIELVHAAIEAGVTFLDNAWEYHDGKSEVRIAYVLKEEDLRASIEVLRAALAVYPGRTQT